MPNQVFVWRESIRGDRPLLQSFCCTIEPGRDGRGRPLPHPRPWEREAQAWIRSQRPPAGPNESLRLEVLDPTLRSVGALAIADHRQDLVVIKLRAIAISAANRGGDGSVADGAIEEILRTAAVLTEAVGGTRTILVTWVHEQNLPSKRLLDRSGFAFRHALPQSLEEWALEVRIDENADALVDLGA